uniref:Peptidase S1 domain-containing protein n=1 Tax=Lates calcarifer TaxID=8187 RepID=A0A4W6DR76_LATCA
TQHMSSLFGELYLSGVTVSTAMDLQKRIIGGQNCRSDERHYHVRLSETSGKFLCGGSLISDQWILTAAHCWKPGGSLLADVGVHPLNNPKAKPGQIITEHFIYKEKDSKGKDWQHDLMLLKLPEPSNITPIKLDCDPSKVFEVKTLFLFSSDCEFTNDLQCAEATLVQCDEFNVCLKNNYDPKWSLEYSIQALICGKHSGVDICKGDSGGGVVFKKQIYGVLVLIGDVKNPCMAPFAFMDICNEKYLKWIKETANI